MGFAFIILAHLHKKIKILGYMQKDWRFIFIEDDYNDEINHAYPEKFLPCDM